MRLPIDARIAPWSSSPLATCFYFTSNTPLVSGVLALVETKPLLSVWKQCYLWSFPYYLIGASIAGLVVLCANTMGARRYPC